MFNVYHMGHSIAVYFDFSTRWRLEQHGLVLVDQVTCQLIGNDGRLLSGGRAIRSPLDEPDAMRGMEIALGRALRGLTVDKEVRGKFWEGFFHAMDHLRVPPYPTISNVPTAKTSFYEAA